MGARETVKRDPPAPSGPARGPDGPGANSRTPRGLTVRGASRYRAGARPASPSHAPERPDDW